MPFFTTRPTSRMRPIADETFRSVPVMQQQQQARRRATAARPAGSAAPAANARNCTTRIDEDEHDGDAEDHQQLAKRLPLRRVLPADLVGVADRQLQVGQLRLESRRRRCPGRALRGCRSRAPSAAGSRAAAPPGRSRAPARQRRHRHERAASACGWRSRGSAADRSDTRPAAARAPARADRAGAGRSRTSPSQRRTADPATCSTVRPTPGRSPADRCSTSSRDCRAACRRRRRRRRRCSSISSTGSASASSRSGSSPKILTSIGVGAPSRSPSMSCSSWTNSISASGAASCSFGRRSAMISSADRLRSPRGFSRTRMSPLFCAVAKSPSSDPVRREYDATSGVAGQDLLHRPHLSIGLLRAPSRRASGSRRRSRLRRPAAGSRCRR